MPNKSAAEKYLRKAKKLAVKNAADKKDLKDLKKKIIKALPGADKSKIGPLLVQFQKKIDKSIKSGWLKKNTGNRHKSRLAIAVNKVLKK